MVEIVYKDPNNVLSKLQKGDFSTPSYLKLNFVANKLLLKGKKEELNTLDELKEKITFYPHQVEVALKFLNEMQGRMLIADEVGLGKTIEAGIIIKELLSRGYVKKILILTPASLTFQWQTEMEDKFNLSFELNKSVHHWANYNKIISSIDTAKMPKHIEEIINEKWDLLIIDEIQKLKNKNTKGYKAISRIKSDYKLFLSATPIQNSLLDLYNIIELLDSKYLASTVNEFKRKYTKDKKALEIDNKSDLNDKLKGIMSRSTRRETGLEFTKRNVATTLITETKDEADFSNLALKFIQEQYNSYRKNESTLKGVGTLQLMNMARMLTSCRHSFTTSFRRYLDNHVKDPVARQEGDKILEMNEKLPENKKFQKTIELIQKIRDKIVIFTQFLVTQGEIADKLKNEGYKVETISGSSTLFEKKASIRKFKTEDVDILIGTESLSEGLNLQFCHNLINYDLPWNPMKIEQRIGRVHRIGQEYDVNIYNLSVKGTIEEYILNRLYAKIDLFHTAIGDLADIITNVLDEDGFDKTIFEILMHNTKKIDIKKEMDRLFEKVKRSKRFHENIKKLDNETLSMFDLSPLKNE